MSDWTQDELDALYEHWGVSQPKVSKKTKPLHATDPFVGGGGAKHNQPFNQPTNPSPKQHQ